MDLRPLPRPLRRIRLYLAAVGAVRRAARRVYDAPWPALYLRALRLRRAHGFAIDEALREGLLDPARTPDPHAVSQRERHAVQARLNPEAARVLVDDKCRFQAHAAEAGLPVPRLVATLDRAGLGWDELCGVPVGPHDWDAVIDAAPCDLVVKPALGHKGDEVHVLVRSAEGWRTVTGEPVATGDLVARMRASRGYARWVVQERLRNHPALDRLGRTDTLQTARIVTYVEADGVVRAACAALKLAGARGGVDNWGAGDAGNVWVRLDLATGALVEGYVAGPGGYGYRIVEADPLTGTSFAGLRVPMWDEAVAVAVRAGEALRPLRTLGMDVAVTRDGPVLVEANCWWDVHPGEPMRDVFRRMEAVA